ncbi:MAG TPA: hypothetical protein HPP87_00305 [Planctomycetes bacterium]|nr:hypothetical protein [Planctomycetota bacterium]
MRFQVFKNGELARDFELSAAYMFGADRVPLRTSSKIRFKNGSIECVKKGPESAGLSLLWPVDGFGKVLLSTTRVPERKRPYNLNVELARARLMQITLKREDWSLFDEETNKFSNMAHHAQDVFIKAVQNIGNPSRASVLADESLKEAMLFSERLAAKHAEIFLAARCRIRGLGRHSLGCCIDPKLVDNAKYRKRLFDMFGYVTIPVNWAQIESEKGYYDFSSIDHCIDVLVGRRLAICAGPLLYFHPDYLPEWLGGSRTEFGKIREAAYEFISRIVTRYSRYIHAWRVISGMNAHNHFSFNFEQMIEITRTACLAARSADNKSRKIVEILLPWGEYYSERKNTVPPLVYADMVIQSAISFDAFAVQMHFGKDRPGMHIRDMMQISSMLDYFAAVVKPVHVTGVAIPGRSESNDQDWRVAGKWHREWDESLQSDWIEQFYKIALGKPFVNSITYLNLADTEDTKILGSGLLTEGFEPKETFLTLEKLQKLILTRQKKGSR